MELLQPPFPAQEVQGQNSLFHVVPEEMEATRKRVGLQSSKANFACDLETSYVISFLKSKSTFQIKSEKNIKKIEEMSQRIKEGDELPEHTFFSLKEGEMVRLNLKDLVKGKKVVIFAVPGAFTPGCSKEHCPSFRKNAKTLKEKGVDSIFCTAVNDCFVLGESPLFLEI